ncbi:MAG: ComF family protein [Monoglobus pectinilyticus]
MRWQKDCQTAQCKILSKPFKRIRQTSKQTDLSSFERQQNLNGAFGLKGNSDNIQGKTILVIDDVTTTGATFNECARVLKLSGAKAVYCAAIATTEKNNGDRDSFT